jgi:NAD(P)-dependent dehydrogenase (short-subunit alcohol dehydrogenase family)
MIPVVARLEGRRALITGAGGGLGTAVAHAYAAEGARLALVGRNELRLRSLCDELDAEAHGIGADVSDPDAAAAAVERATALLGGLDAVVNAAAIDCDWAPVGEMAIDTWDRTIAINLSGTFYVCRAALPHLVADGGGTIVNFTSVAGYKVWAEDVAYNASKAGVDMLTRTIAVEYGPRGVRANCLAPGVIDAGMTDVVTDAGERDELVRMHAIPRMGLASEVAEAAVWLASDASAFTTGSVLRVDGGFLDR